MTKKKQLLFVTDGTKFSDELIYKLKENENVELIIREGAKQGCPVLRSDKGRFQGYGILFYIREFNKGE